ncbi:MAG: hypothetical protein M1274_15470 [Actinobacteria bacterium]|nr:hypothetical protein [Actinomycetota bacterium]
MITELGNVDKAEVYCPAIDAWLPADQVGPDGQALPLPEKVASRIRQIIEAFLETHPEAMAIWIAEAERVTAGKQQPLREAG